MLKIIPLSNRVYPHQINVAINYLTHSRSEIRDNIPYTDIIHNDNNYWIFLWNDVPIGFMISFMKSGYFLIELFEIFNPYRGHKYAEMIINELEVTYNQQVIITHPLSIRHWFHILGYNYFRKKIRKIGISKFYSLVRTDRFGVEFGEEERFPLYRRLMYEDGDPSQWKEYLIAIKHDYIHPVINLEEIPDYLGNICYVKEGLNIIGRLMYNGSFLPLRSIDKELLLSRFPEVKFEIPYFIPSYLVDKFPQINEPIPLDSYLTYMGYGNRLIKQKIELSSYDFDDIIIDYRNRLYFENTFLGVLLADDFLLID